MGQGHYSAIVFGAIEPPTDVEDEDGYTVPAEWYETAVKAAEEEHRVHFDSSYESEPCYKGIMVAVSDGWLAKQYKIPELANVVIDLSDANWIEVEAANPTIVGLARAAWEDIRGAGRAAGVEIPEGRFLLVFDYD